MLSYLSCSLSAERSYIQRKAHTNNFSLYHSSICYYKMESKLHKSVQICAKQVIFQNINCLLIHAFKNHLNCETASRETDGHA